MNNEYLLGYFFESTSIPVLVCRSDGTIVYSYPSSFVDVYTPEFLENCMKDFETNHLEQGHPLIQMIPSSFLLGTLKIKEDEYLILGPVSSIQVAQKEIMDFCRIAVQPNRILEFNGTISRIPIMNYRHFISSVAIAVKLSTGLNTRLEDIVLFNTTSAHFEVDTPLTQKVFELREHEVLHTAYDFEQDMQAAIEAGDVERLKSIVLQPVTGRVGQMSTDILQQEKFTFVAATSMISRAAVRGGMDYEAACSLADIYCQQMDSMQRIQDISTLIFRMALDFCHRVSESHGEPDLSKPVRDCCHYISKHLHDDIRIEDLAKNTGFCNKTISQKFLAETGISISDYIHREKMREAAYLLKLSTHTISDISNYLQYSSQSYFTRIFRNNFGITPRQYRIQNQK